ncbi:MAG TPA: AI-2E family transporter [Ktedonosporobacter sp.]|jgi:predicted PurR-regulated permease PerM|nr:AI-2E family transporter [Ktedonosporobacter sp.]
MPVNTRWNASSEETQTQPESSIAIIAKWARRCGRPITILAWIGVVFVILWAAGYVIRMLVILLIAALLAFAAAPLVKTLQRVMPRFLAILIVYLLVFSGLSLLLYTIVRTAIEQGTALALQIQHLFSPAGQQQLKALERPLIALGIPPDQLAALPQQILSHVGGLANNAVPVLLSFFDFMLDAVIIAVISIYLLIDGARVAQWARTNLPMVEQHRANFMLDTLQRVVGGYIRGQLLLSTFIGLLVGIGMALFHVPYALLLGVMAFVLEFIPVLGTIVSGAICALLALTQGWLITLGVIGYFSIVHIIEGDVIGPRIVGKAVGLHPIVSLAALVAGAELFGIWGALFASPIAGVLQAFLIAFWSEWRTRHPEQFPGQKEAGQQIEQYVADAPVEPHE